MVLDQMQKIFYLSEPRFLDLFNALLYDGEEVLKAGHSREARNEQNNGSKRHFTDVTRIYENGDVYSILILENQSTIDISMVIRALNYEANVYDTYRKQEGRFNKNTRVPAAYCLVYYTGECRWSAPTKLSELVDLDDQCKKFFNDYQMNLIEINDDKEYKFNNRDNRLYRDLTKAIYRDEDLDQEEYKHVPVEVAELVFETTQSEIELSLEEEDEVDMCTAVRNKYDKLRSEGRAEGITSTTFNDILSIMESFHVSFNQAMTSLKITDAEEQEMYQKRYDALTH